MYIFVNYGEIYDLIWFWFDLFVNYDSLCL